MENKIKQRRNSRNRTKDKLRQNREGKIPKNIDQSRVEQNKVVN